MKDGLIAASLGLIMALNLVDLVTDIRLGVPAWHLVHMAVIITVSAVAMLYLLWETRRRTLEMNNLRQSVANADQKLANVTEEMQRERHHYAAVIQQQFTDWALTLSEQQVAMLLLKGLSFREIASLRNTREKTVRQQASTIYGKSNLEGRHAFSAWFLEDFLST